MPNEPQPMTAESIMLIEKTRSLTRRLFTEVGAHGAPSDDVLTGMALGLHDVAAGALGGAEAALTWHRQVTELIASMQRAGVDMWRVRFVD